MYSKAKTGFESRPSIPIIGAIWERKQLVNTAITHKFGLVVLALTFAVVLTMLFAPVVPDRLSGWWPLVLVWGLLCYAISVVAVSRTRPTPSEPELQELERVRRMIHTRIKEREASGEARRSVLTRVLIEAHDQIDRRMMPALAELIELQRDLTRSLDDFDQGRLPKPEPDKLAVLRKMHSRRAAVIEECVTQASNGAATLIALLQERDESTVTGNAEMLVRDLEAVHEALRRATTNDWPTRPEPVVADIEPGKREPMPAVEFIGDESDDPDDPGDATVEPVDGDQGTTAFTQTVEYKAAQAGLRRLNRPPDLARCPLATVVPLLLHSMWQELYPEASTRQPTPLELAQAMRTLLLSELDMLKPADERINPVDPAVAHYFILHEQYVIGRPVNNIYPRMAVSEGLYYAKRREAIAAVARDLLSKEALLRNGKGNGRTGAISASSTRP